MSEVPASRNTAFRTESGYERSRTSISVIIPVFNNRELLPQAVASVRRQTRAVDEIIVVDDGSTDGSADVAESLGVRVLRLPENRGPSAARNAAVCLADGEFVAFLDSDDTWGAHHCELLAEALERHPHAALVTSRTQNVSPLYSSPHRPPLGAPFDALPYLVRENFVTQSAAFVRRQLFVNVGGYDETMRFSEDYDLWLRLALERPMLALSNITVMRRLHQGQATWNNKARLYSASWRLRLALLDAPRLRSDVTRLAEVEEALREAVDLDFEYSWRDLDATSFAIIEAAAAHVPGAERARLRWQRRRKFLWHSWVAAVRLRRAIRSVARRS